MSGGHFDYTQFHIGNIADSIEQKIIDNGKPKSKEELDDESWRGTEWYEKYPEYLSHTKYSDEVIEEFKNGLSILRKAHVYAQRIDWLLSDDDGEESFLARLKKELDELDDQDS